jgi:hypothetical protein
MERLIILTNWVDTFDKILIRIYKKMGNDIITDIYKDIDIMENTQFPTTNDEIDTYNDHMDTFMNRISQIEKCTSGIKTLFWEHFPHSNDEFIDLLDKTDYPNEFFYDYTKNDINTKHGFDMIYNDYLMNYLFSKTSCVYKELKRMYIPLLMEFSHSI